MVDMSIFSTRPALRWLVPVAVVVVVIGGGAAARTISAAAEPSLPDRSAAQLLVDLQTARVDGLSGTVRTSANLGLPALPALGGQGSADLTALISGSRTLRVWYSGPDKARLALLGTLGESDIIRNGRDLWFWDSRTKTATHQLLSESQSARARPDAAALPRTPQEAADLALRAVDPTTIVSTGTNARVAGRSAYELILAPRDTASLIGEVRLAIDSREHVPLRFQVYAKGGGDPAYEVAFTQVSFSRPGDAQFRFNPPPGTTVEEAPAAPDGAKPQGTDPAAAGERRLVGTGWTTVLIARAPADGAAPDRSTGPGGLIEQLPRVSGAWGSGRLISGRLFSALFTDDGRVLVGAVSPERLYEAAGG
jgi:outer membrane lipoprotein-sorting protein